MLEARLHAAAHFPGLRRCCPLAVAAVLESGAVAVAVIALIAVLAEILLRLLRAIAIAFAWLFALSLIRGTGLG